ncbi:unnamed protein product [Withania somnifera]
MAIFDLHHPWVFVFGVLGNIISILVFLAPVPAFRRICKEKSTMGFQSVPYVVALFSSMLWMYYAFIKKNATLLVSINSFGCIVETIYISIFILYASKEARLPNVLGFFLGMIQMLLYGLYRNVKPAAELEKEVPEHVINMVAVGNSEQIHPLNSEDMIKKLHDQEGNRESTISPPVANDHENDERPCGKLAQVNLQPIQAPVLVVCAA